MYRLRSNDLTCCSSGLCLRTSSRTAHKYITVFPKLSRYSGKNQKKPSSTTCADDNLNIEKHESHERNECPLHGCSPLLLGGGVWGGREKYGPNLFYLFGQALFAIATTPSFGHPSSPEEGTTLDVAPLYLEGQGEALRARILPSMIQFLSSHSDINHFCSNLF